MNILKNAKAHFSDKVSDDLSFVDVPEWGDDEENPARIYYRKAMSLKTQDAINKYAQDGSLQAFIEILTLRSLDVDGKRLWAARNRTEFMNYVDPAVMGRVCEAMAEDDTTLEDATGN